MSHRRKSINNNDGSSENLSIPTIQRTVDPITISQQRQNQPHSLMDQKSYQSLNDRYLSTIDEKKNAQISKFHESVLHKKDRRTLNPSYINYGLVTSLRRILYIVAFFGALVIFLGSLCGIETPFDEVITDPDQTTHKIVSSDEGHIFTGITEDDKQKIDITNDSNYEHNNNDRANDYNNNENYQDKNNLDNTEIKKGEIADLFPDDELLDEPIIQDEGFGHFDEILSKNDKNSDISSHDINYLSEEDLMRMLNPTVYSILNKSTQISGRPNKLLKKMHRHYHIKSRDTDEEINVIDYSEYIYKAPQPHFTYVDVINSLTNEELADIKTIQSLEINTDESLDSSCGKWQEEYSKLHANILDNKEEQRYVTYICDASTNCGGLADRIFGMTSTFLFALLTNRAFLADWQVPIPLEAVFSSPNIDWSYDSLSPLPSLISLQSSELNVVDFDAQHLDQYFMLHNWTQKYPKPFIKFYTNRGMIMRTFSSKHYSKHLKDIGLRPHTAIGCILDYLFRPVPEALWFITEYTSLFALPSIFSVGIQIRTGDSKMNKNDGLGHSHSLQEYKHFFKCADQLTQVYSAPSQKVIYFLVTDSVRLRDEAIQKLEHVIVSGLPVSGEGHKGEDYNWDKADEINHAIIENWILSKTDYRVISPGGYGKLSAFHSKQLHSTVSMVYSGLNDGVPDCTREDAFTTFNKLASELSLG
ncbi:17158_t:CDS:2 [Cetraspora pellucida]|uniref:17158_t:CDS:1 n=1 Tax=Cetraspora pellucida TaxID=1433469 RepID=A0A9N9B0M6_9GLOM|nr:17158_t:CDS:2 [Cetraspora pellucida]